MTFTREAQVTAAPGSHAAHSGRRYTREMSASQVSHEGPARGSCEQDRLEA